MFRKNSPIDNKVGNSPTVALHHEHRPWASIPWTVRVQNGKCQPNHCGLITLFSCTHCLVVYTAIR
jgi:hypothetical protein